jgi:ligand-binding SRPBCC domain-containing protein
MRFKVETRVAQDPETVFPVFGDKAFVESLAPGFMGVKVLRIGLALGDEIEIRFTRLGPRGPWFSRIVSLDRGPGGITFVDRSLKLPWPYATFEHHHGILADGSGSRLVDEPSFTVRPRILAPVVWLFLRWSFAMRGRAYRRRFGTPG